MSDLKADLLVGEDGAVLKMDGQLTASEVTALANKMRDSEAPALERLAAARTLLKHIDEPACRAWRPPLAGMGDEG